MRALDIAVEPLLSIAQLKSLVDAPGPCVSIYRSSYAEGNSPLLFSTRMDAMFGSARQELHSQCSGVEMPDLLFEPVSDAIMRSYRERHRGSFAVFLSRTVSRILWTAQPLTELMRIDDIFYLRPMISSLASVADFNVLGISQKNIRLLRCTDADCRVVQLPDGVPRCVDEAVGLDVPDHDLENRSAAGGAEGARRGIRFSTGTEDKRSDAYILRFFSILNEHINRLLRAEQTPLVICAAERELALYRKSNTYPLLISQGVHGSPEWLSDAQLREQALLALKRERMEADFKTAAQFSEKTAGMLLEKDPELILAAAGNGNVRAVLLPETIEDALGEDLLNLIAVQTLRKGGDVLTVAAQAMPSTVMAVALLRHTR